MNYDEDRGRKKKESQFINYARYEWVFMWKSPTHSIYGNNHVTALMYESVLASFMVHFVCRGWKGWKRIIESNDIIKHVEGFTFFITPGDAIFQRHLSSTFPFLSSTHTHTHAHAELFFHHHWHVILGTFSINYSYTLKKCMQAHGDSTYL